MGPNRALVPFYEPGDDVPKSGIYRVRHQGHHHDHEVICISGTRFPNCHRCRDKVRFSLILAAHAIERHMHFFPPPEEGSQSPGLQQSA